MTIRIAVYTDRVTRADGRQFIYAQEKKLDLPFPVTEGFIDYKQVRSQLPREFIDNIESISFRDHDKNKELIEKSITGVNSPTDLERWIDVTEHLIDEEVKKKLIKGRSKKTIRPF